MAQIRSHGRAAGYRWEVFARSVIDYYGGLCWCGHGGARQVDHVIPVAERPDLAFDMSNCRPAHGAPGNPCPQCSAACGRKIHCNQLRGALTVTRAKRIIAERAAEFAGTRKTPLPGRHPGAGREWLLPDPGVVRVPGGIAAVMGS